MNSVSLPWLQILVTPDVRRLSPFISFFLFFLQVLLLEPVNETLQSSPHGDEDEEVMGLDVIQNLRNTQEAGNRGEDWEEVTD